MPVAQSVHFSETDRKHLSVALHRGKATVCTIKRAQILSKVDAG